MRNFLKAIWPHKIARFIIIFFALFSVSSLFHLGSLTSTIGLLSLIHSVVLPGMVICALTVLYEKPNK